MNIQLNDNRNGPTLFDLIPRPSASPSGNRGVFESSLIEAPPTQSAPPNPRPATQPSPRESSRRPENESRRPANENTTTSQSASRLDDSSTASVSSRDGRNLGTRSSESSNKQDQRESPTEDTSSGSKSDGAPNATNRGEVPGESRNTHDETSSGDRDAARSTEASDGTKSDKKTTSKRLKPSVPARLSQKGEAQTATTKAESVDARQAPRRTKTSKGAKTAEGEPSNQVEDADQPAAPFDRALVPTPLEEVPAESSDQAPAQSAASENTDPKVPFNPGPSGVPAFVPIEKGSSEDFIPIEPDPQATQKIAPATVKTAIAEAVAQAEVKSNPKTDKTTLVLEEGAFQVSSEGTDSKRSEGRANLKTNSAKNSPVEDGDGNEEKVAAASADGVVTAPTKAENVQQPTPAAPNLAPPSIAPHTESAASARSDQTNPTSAVHSADGATPKSSRGWLTKESTDSSAAAPRGFTIDGAKFVHRVAGAIKAAQERGGAIRLRLSPPELGSLRLELRVGQGELSAKLETETAIARTTLLEHLPILKDRLAEQGIRLEGFEVNVSDGWQGGSGFSGDQQPAREPGSQPPTRRIANQNTEPAFEPTRGAVRTVGDRQINVVI